MSDNQELKQLREMVADHDKILSKQNEELRDMWLVIKGDEGLNIKGMIERQQDDENFRAKLMKKLDEMAIVNHKDYKDITHRITSLESYTSGIDAFIKIAGNSKFWRFIGWIIFILAISYATLSDEIRSFIEKFKP